MRTRHRHIFVTVLICLGAMLGIVPSQGQFPPQPSGVVSCTATSVAPIVRRSNIAALQGDVVLVWTRPLPPRWISTSSSARLLGVTDRTVRRYARHGLIPSRQTSGGQRR